MFAEFGPAPLSLELDIDSYDGPWQNISRFRNGAGWLLVSKCTIQSEHDLLSSKLVAACTDWEKPIPAFQAKHLTECDWVNPSYCDELPPDVLDDLICEEERALLFRWHREKNSALAEAFEEQEMRVAELEGRVQSVIGRNELRIAELKQRRRHPDATPEIRSALAEVVRELDEMNERLLSEMAETRSAIRKHAQAREEALWAREELLIQSEPLHIVRWRAMRTSRYAPPPFEKPRTVQYVPACGRTGGSTFRLGALSEEVVASLTKSVAAKAPEQTQADPEPKREEKAPKPKREPVSEADRQRERLRNEYVRLQRAARKLDEEIEPGRRNAERRRQIEAELRHLDQAMGGATNAAIADDEAQDEIAAGPRLESAASGKWTESRIALLREMWLAGHSAGTIAEALADTTRNAVIGKAHRLGLPATARSNVIDERHSVGSQPAEAPRGNALSSAAVQDAISALSAARKRYYGEED